MTKNLAAHTSVSPEILELAVKHGNHQESLLEILTDLQRKHGVLSKESIQETSQALNMAPSQVYGVSTFYSMLSQVERKNVMRVCDGPVCWMKGSAKTREALEKNSTGWSVERTSCLGLCDRAPAVLMNDEQVGPVFPEDGKKIHQGWRGVSTDYSSPRSGETRVLLANIANLDHDSIESALKYGAYEGLRKTLGQKPEEVIEVVEKSGLQGRGGAGFPVGRKWQFVANAKRTPKYILCNADESEPLIFKDRVLIDSNPHQLLEGILIAGYACGATEAWIYIRGEYEPQAARLEQAIELARQKGFLGERILETDFNFNIHIHRGAGAYICGEETALIESLEGKRGEPRIRPPYPPSYGFRGQPTAVNNVETLSAVPSIVRNGADWWRSLSTYTTPGTKLYMVLGQVKTPGLFEAPFGITLRQVIDDFGGGMLDGSVFHMALCGGAAGTIVNEKHLDIPLDYGSAQKGISIGAGSFLICDQSVSPVALLRELLHFFSSESCGKCTPCRVGTWRAFEILKGMTDTGHNPGAIQDLRSISDHLLSSSFCGLGQSVSIPINSALNNFSEVFIQREERVGS
jgi:NADH:ubiquinone oxidoreductase subunit F (NADH-binding)/NADH:ubiquinone oxidoreductase subunit E